MKGKLPDLAYYATLDNSPMLNEDFAVLIPRNAALTEHPQETITMSESKKAWIMNEFRTWENKLQNIFDYRNKRESELQKAFYIKPFFILRNRVPERDTKTAIMILAADRDLFFKDADGRYRDKNQNKRNISNRKRRRREIKKDDRDLIENSLQETFVLLGNAWSEVTSRPDIELARKVVYAVINEAKSANGLKNWLYSFKHVALSEDNRAFYEDRYQSFSEDPDEDGYSDKNNPKVFPENKAEQDRFVRALLKSNRRSLDMISVKCCIPDFQRLTPECVENPICSKDFYDKIIFCLDEYLSNKSLINFKSSSEDEYINKNRIYSNYGYFQSRYQKIRALEDAFLKLKIFSTDLPKSIEIDWETGKIKQGDKTEETVNAIEEYCRQANVPVKWNEEYERFVIFQNGIEWILNPSKQSKYLFIQFIFLFKFLNRHSLSYHSFSTSSL